MLLRSCFELFEMFFEVKNLHFLPASSVRQHRCLPGKERSNLKCFTLDPATSDIWLTFQPISSKLKFFTLNPVPGPRAIELVRIAEVSSRGRACS